MSHWGLLPEEVYTRIKSIEWDNHNNRQKRLTGVRSFPLVISLRLPTDQQALSNITHFQAFVAAWRQFPLSHLLEWVTKNYRSLQTQQMPKRLVIPSMQMLLEYLGEEAVSASRKWEASMAPLVAFNPDFFPVLIKHLATVEKLSMADSLLLIDLLPQMQRNMGLGLYLRALPFIGVDTKFVETLAPLITDLLDVIYKGQITDSGGLKAWLACQQNPAGWIVVRPLYASIQTAMGGFPILQLPMSELQAKALPASNILVVENLQTGLALPQLPNTVAVCGGGRNISWMDAPWLKGKHVGYWGDLDTWGLAILSDARALAPHLTPIMMDKKTLRLFKDRMVPESDKYASTLLCLQEDEIKLFKDLHADAYGMGRLEQERLPADYALQCLEDWLRNIFYLNYLATRRVAK